MNHRLDVSPFSGNPAQAAFSGGVLDRGDQIDPAAQARLGKGKSAISLTLGRLEERLAMRLCERGRSGFRLTEQGQMVHSAALQLLDEIGRFNDFIGAATRKLEDEISFFCDDSFLYEFGDPLARAIARTERCSKIWRGDSSRPAARAAVAVALMPAPPCCQRPDRDRGDGPRVW